MDRDAGQTATPNITIFLGAGDLARLGGVTRQQVHFEALDGSLPPDARTASGLRLWKPETAARWAAERRRRSAA